MAARKPKKKSQIKKIALKFKDRAFIVGADNAADWLTPVPAIPSDISETPAFVLVVGNINAAERKTELDGISFIDRTYDIFKTKHKDSQVLFLKNSELEKLKEVFEWI